MTFISTIHTDVGIKKKTNQDSALVVEAETERGSVLLACVCDGMGGLAKGEVASAALVRSFNEWFYRKLPAIIYSDFTENDIRNGLRDILLDMSGRIMMYGKNQGINLGTTAVVAVIFNNRYYIINVGDSRAYLLSDRLCQITKDQTFIQREMDMGRLTPEEAEVHPQRNVLLQCIGASEVVLPDFYIGEFVSGQELLLCSDGFRHIITPEEIYATLNPALMTDANVMKTGLYNLTELNKQRREQDNITALLLKAV